MQFFHTANRLEEPLGQGAPLAGCLPRIPVFSCNRSPPSHLVWKLVSNAKEGVSSLPAGCRLTHHHRASWTSLTFAALARFFLVTVSRSSATNVHLIAVLPPTCRASYTWCEFDELLMEISFLTKIANLYWPPDQSRRYLFRPLVSPVTPRRSKWLSLFYWCDHNPLSYWILSL